MNSLLVVAFSAKIICQCNTFQENTLNQLVGAAFGAAGQRCMALSTVVFVGESKEWIKDLKERSEKLVVNAGIETNAI